MSWTNCNDCGAQMDSDAHPEVFRAVGSTTVPICNECFGPKRTCLNCNRSRTTPTQRWHMENFPGRGQSVMCDYIKDELFVEFLQLDRNTDGAVEILPENFECEVPSDWGCNEWASKK